MLIKLDISQFISYLIMKYPVPHCIPFGIKSVISGLDLSTSCLSLSLKAFAHLLYRFETSPKRVPNRVGFCREISRLKMEVERTSET
jgi:hypothetical protein